MRKWLQAAAQRAWEHVDWDWQDSWALVLALTIYALLVLMAGRFGG